MPLHWNFCRSLSASKRRGLRLCGVSASAHLQSVRLMSDEKHGGQIVANVLKAHDVDHIFTLVSCVNWRLWTGFYVMRCSIWKRPK